MEVFFDYNKKVIEFLEKLIDGNPEYVKMTAIFEKLIAPNPKNPYLTDTIDKPPLVFRRFVAKNPKLRDVAFYYIYSIEGEKTYIKVIDIQFADETPIF